MKPRVSVVIPCFNMGRYIEETVDSVFAQTMQDFEIIIVNDGSTDEETNRLLSGYDRPKTTVFTTPNGGPSAARNAGIAKAVASYIFPLDADDLLEPTCLEKTARLLDENQEISIVNFWYEGFGDMAFTIGAESCGLKEILSENKLCGNALFRRKVWEDVGGYDESFREGYEDWDFWISALEKGHGVHVIREVLFRYRFRLDSRNYLCQYSGKHFETMKMIIEKHRGSYREHWLEALMAREKCIGEMFAYQKELEEAKKWYIEGRKEHERYIVGLDARVEDLARQQREMYRTLQDTKREQRRLLGLRDDELRAVYASKAWRAGCALQEARHSLKGMLHLPLRLARASRPGGCSRKQGKKQ